MNITQKSFTLIKEEDITDNTLPTLDFGSYCYRQYMLPAAEIISDMLDNKVPGVVKFL